MSNDTTPIKVPVPRPYTRVKIKPGQRHRDKKKDYKRKPKYPEPPSSSHG